MDYYIDLAITKPLFLGPVCDLYCEVLPESGSSLSVTFHLSDSDSLSVCEYLLSLLCRGRFSGITIQYVSLHVLYSGFSVVYCCLAVLVNVADSRKLTCSLFAVRSEDQSMDEYVSRVLKRFDFTFSLSSPTRSISQSYCLILSLGRDHILTLSIYLMSCWLHVFDIHRLALLIQMYVYSCDHACLESEAVQEDLWRTSTCMLLHRIHCRWQPCFSSSPHVLWGWQPEERLPWPGVHWHPYYPLYCCHVLPGCNGAGCHPDGGRVCLLSVCYWSQYKPYCQPLPQCLGVCVFTLDAQQPSPRIYLVSLMCDPQRG